MSPLSKALIACITKLKIVLIAANSSCANIQSMIKFLYFFQQRELSIFYLLFCAILHYTKRCQLFKINNPLLLGAIVLIGMKYEL